MKRESIANAAAGTGPDQRIAVAMAAGDGIGPEIMQATLAVLEAAGAPVEPDWIEVGEPVYLAGHSSGITPQAWDTLRRRKVFLKGPISTPAGGGYKSLNVTIRKTLGLYANVRPCTSYGPVLDAPAGAMDVVVVRENEEDLYAGIEHRQTDEVYQCLKLITRPGCERIARYAFEYARAHGRRKVTCMVKDNIMKMTDGLFWRVFDEIGAQYPEIARDRLIVDIGAARLATRPGTFDVLVLPNLYGDILSDVAAELSGSVGLAGSSNIGEHVAMFEAIHGSAPDLAGKGVANPSGLLLAAVMMLVHLRQPQVAERIHNAWLCTIEDGVHTADICNARTVRRVGTSDFTQAVIERLGQVPRTLRPAHYALPSAQPLPAPVRRPPAEKRLVGVDVFVHCADLGPEQLGRLLQPLAATGLTLQMITNRGVKVWPGGFPETFCTDHWRCRFVANDASGRVTPEDVIRQLSALVGAGIDVIKTENLCTFDGERGFALGQGQ